jgi:hypothetical protein
MGAAAAIGNGVGQLAQHAFPFGGVRQQIDAAARPLALNARQKRMRAVAFSVGSVRASRDQVEVISM